MRNEWRVLTLPTYSGSVPVYSSRTKNWFQTQLRFCLCRASHERLGSVWGRSGVASADLSPQQLMFWAARSQTAQHIRRPQKLIWVTTREIASEIKQKYKRSEIYPIQTKRSGWNPLQFVVFPKFLVHKTQKSLMWLQWRHSEGRSSRGSSAWGVSDSYQRKRDQTRVSGSVVDFLKKICPRKPHCDSRLLGESRVL